MFLDLNLPLDDEHSAAGGAARAIDFEHVDRRVAMAQQLGYDGVAIAHVVAGKLTPADQAYVNETRGGPTGGASRTLQVGPTQASSTPAAPHRFSRLTLVLDTTTMNQQLVLGQNGGNPVMMSYDLVAIQPGSEKIFQTMSMARLVACANFDIDIITLDLSSRLPFSLKFGAVHQAVQRGVFFEITYSPVLRTAAARRNLIGNALNLVRVTKGRNLLISSGALKALELRGPYDVANLATLFGLSTSDAKACLSTNARAVLYHAEMRRNTYRGAVAIPLPLEPAAPAKADKAKRPQTAPGPPVAAAPPAKRARAAAEPAIVGLADPDRHEGRLDSADDGDGSDDAMDDDEDDAPLKTFM